MMAGLLATTFSSAPFITSWPWCFFESFTSGPVTRRLCPCLLINALQKGLQIPPLHQGPFSCGRNRSVSSSSYCEFVTADSWLRMGMPLLRLRLHACLRNRAAGDMCERRHGVASARGNGFQFTALLHCTALHCTRNMWPIRAAGYWVVVRQRGSGAQFSAWLRNDNFHRNGAAYTLKSYYT
jgi:hypothetical protein